MKAFKVKVIQKKLNLEDVIEIEMPRVYIGEVPTLDGKTERRVLKVGDGSIIKLFDKTPMPRKSNDIVCPHFLELKWANGCNFNCAWCYLQGTFRFIDRGKKPYIKDWNKIVTHLKALFYYNGKTKPELINAGELSDSLIGEKMVPPASKRLIELFNEQNYYKLLLVTKSNMIDNLVKIEPKNTIISFSINAYPVAERWEKGAPHPYRRIEAAKRLHEHGYEIRIRIDPVVPVTNWKKHYSTLIDELFKQLEPERITFGTLRGLWATINNCNDKSWIKFVLDGENTNWGMRPKFEIRLKMFRYLLEMLENEYSFKNYALCKETVGIWSELELDFQKIKCNCML